MNHHPRNSSSWSDLPHDLIRDIATRIPTKTHAHNLRAVCKTWCQCIPLSLVHSKPILSPLFPLTISKPSASTKPKTFSLPTSPSPWVPDWGSELWGAGKSFTLVAISVCLIRPCTDPTQCPWLASIVEFPNGQLLHRILVKQYPRDFPKVLENLSRFEISEDYKCHRLINGNKNSRLNGFYRTKFLAYRSGVVKVVLFASPSSTNPNLKDCIFLFLLYDWSLLAMKVGEENEGLMRTYFPEMFKVWRFCDMVNFNGEVYAVDMRGGLHAISYGDLQLRKIIDGPICMDNTIKKLWLVASSGKLYLISRGSLESENHNIKLKVFELDEKGRAWRCLSSIGCWRVLFMTYDGCFFVSVRDLPGCWRGDCIVYPRGCFYANAVDRNDVIVYDYTNHDSWSILCKPGYVGLLWPPPSWLSSNWPSPRLHFEEEKEMSSLEIEAEGQIVKNASISSPNQISGEHCGEGL